MAYTTIDDPSAYFQSKIYTGINTNGGPGQSLTFDGNSDLQPDMMIWSNRTSGYQRPLMDSTIGVGAQFWTDANENASDFPGILSSFNSDGWTIPATGTGSNSTNLSPKKYVGWAWKCNGGTTSALTTVSGGISGSNNSIQTNSTSKFSIVKYRSGTATAGTFTHGLGVKPEFMIFKKRGTDEWVVYHHRMVLGNYGVESGDPEDNYMELSTRIAATNDAGFWNDTAPTSSTVSLGTDSQVNGGSSIYYHAWIWAGVKGYSRFGAYEGNGESSKGPFVCTGFKPAWIMIRNTENSGAAWYVYDRQRRPHNPNGKIFFMDASGAEGSDQSINILSNGFQVCPHDAHGSGVGSASTNESGKRFIYAAFAEHPVVTSGGAPTTAN